MGVRVFLKARGFERHGPRVAAILAMSGFDTSGVARAASLLRKDVDIALELADASEAPPTRVLADATTTVETLEELR